MSCEDGAPKDCCSALGSTGLPPELSQTEEQYVCRVVRAAQFPSLPQYARRQMKKVARSEARQTYRAKVMEAFTSGKLSADQAIELVGAEGFAELVAIIIDQRIHGGVPLRSATEWSSEDEFVNLTLPADLAQHLPSDQVGRFRERAAHRYKLVISQAIADGQIDLETSIKLIPLSDAEPAYCEWYRKIGHTLTRQQYVERLYGIAWLCSRRGLEQEHADCVESALLQGMDEQIPREVLADYPGLVAKHRPWTMKFEDWLYAEQDRLNAPMVWISTYSWTDEKGRVSTLERTMWKVQSRLAEARSKHPDTQWEIEEVGYGRRRVRYRVIGKNYIWPEKEATLNELAPLYPKLITESLADGKPVPMDVLMQYPDLMAIYGVS